MHVGADVDSIAAHTVEITAANEADINILPKLLRVAAACMRGKSARTVDDEAETGENPTTKCRRKMNYWKSVFRKHSSTENYRNGSEQV